MNGNLKIPEPLAELAAENEEQEATACQVRISTELFEEANNGTTLSFTSSSSVMHEVDLSTTFPPFP